MHGNKDRSCTPQCGGVTKEYEAILPLLLFLLSTLYIMYIIPHPPLVSGGDNEPAVNFTCLTSSTLAGTWNTRMTCRRLPPALIGAYTIKNGSQEQRDESCPCCVTDAPSNLSSSYGMNNDLNAFSFCPKWRTHRKDTLHCHAESPSLLHSLPPWTPSHSYHYLRGSEISLHK